jgi:metal-responsive CopG/Arc/MetJ family transcriptional regulator
MRTYVELADSKLRALRALAARRGYRGYSRLLAEAVDEYLKRHAGEADEERAARIARLEGSLSEGEARAMRKAVRDIRRERA